MPVILSKASKLFMILLIPILILGGAVRLLASEPYLAFEYGKASFPADRYGFTQEQRFDLASTNIHYIRAHLPENVLSLQTLDAAPAYNSREIGHMADVRSVYQSFLRVWQLAFVLFLVLAMLLMDNGKKAVLVVAIRSGGVLTTGIILFIAFMALFAWQAWFNLFHRFLFAPGSWLFSYSDTLIRLFPIKFWLDATLTISFFSLVAAVILAGAGWRWQAALKRTAEHQ